MGGESSIRRESSRHQTFGCDDGGSLERDNPFHGKPLRRRIGPAKPTVEGILESGGAPLAYMTRLKRIEDLVTRHEERLRDARAATAREAATHGSFARAWREVVRLWDFSDVNTLIDEHNRCYPLEASLPIDRMTGELVARVGPQFPMENLDSRWILKRFPLSDPVDLGSAVD
jgi:hypothetical protein